MTKTMSEAIELVKSSAEHEVVGYESWEIPKIEKLYDIEVNRSLKEFLLAMGRCSGGSIGDESVILYSNFFSIRSYISIQLQLIDELQNLKHFELVGLNPFLFAIEAETYYHFLLTKEEGEQFVYVFSENDDTVTKTRETFSSYIYRKAKWGIEFYLDQTIVCCGDLLRI
ncbi:SMI1/KNR4 family protein [Lusitaniella coriacea]|uniref:SMI1/KNR4 family protein n=1 Tax=Lusitaniella coriacea TaxID=1983105 RepID=UPI003CEC525A